jgi:hypothetical protein
MARIEFYRRLLGSAALALPLLIEGPARALGEPQQAPEPALQVRSKAPERDRSALSGQLHFSQPLRISPTVPGHSLQSRPQVSGFRNRSVKVVRYAQPVRFGQSDYILKLEAPGKRRSFVSFELVFF